MIFKRNGQSFAILLIYSHTYYYFIDKVISSKCSAIYLKVPSNLNPTSYMFYDFPAKWTAKTVYFYIIDLFSHIFIFICFISNFLFPLLNHKNRKTNFNSTPYETVGLCDRNSTMRTINFNFYLISFQL